MNGLRDNFQRTIDYIRISISTVLRGDRLQALSAIISAGNATASADRRRQAEACLFSETEIDLKPALRSDAPDHEIERLHELSIAET
jgi:molybdenum cofactor biosynthesis enzyme MoaA